MSEQMSEADRNAMQIGAETARQPKKIGGLDGRGWVEQIEKNPMTTMPPGAGALVVNYFRAEAAIVREAATMHLRSASHMITNNPTDLRVVENGITAAINLLSR